MKKILFIIPSMTGGGVERCLLNILNRMDQNVYDITVLAIKSGGELICAIPAGVKYRYCWKNRVTLFGKRIPGTDRLFQWIWRSFSEKMLHWMFVKDRYDIEVDYWGQEGLKLILGSEKNTRKVVFIHTYMNTDSLRKSYFPYSSHVQLRDAYLRSDVVANVSSDCLQSMVDRFNFSIEEQKKFVVSYNINLTNEIIDKGNELLNGIDTKSFIICSSGRLIEKKGFERLIEVFFRLQEVSSNIVLWIMGEGEKREEIEEKINKLHLNDKVILWGFQKNPYKYMKASDLFVCSSYYEGFSTVVSEAVILGVPVVSTDCTGAKEILGNSEYGLITGLDDESLYLGLKRMITEQETYKFYSKKVKERQSFFDADKRMKEFLQLLK